MNLNREEIIERLDKNAELYKSDKKSHNAYNLSQAVYDSIRYLNDDNTDVDEELLEKTILYNTYLPPSKRNHFNYGADFVPTFPSKYPKPLIDYFPQVSQKKSKVKPLYFSSIPYPINPDNIMLQTIFEPVLLKDDLRPILTGIYFNDNQATGTNAHILLHITGKKEGKFKNGIYKTEKDIKKDYKQLQKEVGNIGTFESYKKKANMIEGKYPNFPAIIPNDTEKVATINIKNLDDILETITYNKLYSPESRDIKITFDNDLQDKYVVYFNVEYLKSIVQALLKLDIKEVDFFNQDPKKALILTEKDTWDGKRSSEILNKTFGLVMPTMGFGEQLTHIIIKGENRFDLELGGGLPKEYIYQTDVKETKIPKKENKLSSKIKNYLDSIEGYEILIDMEDDSKKIESYKEEINGYEILLEIEGYKK